MTVTESSSSPSGSRLATHFLWNLSVGGWGLLLALFSTPYVVHRLGVDRYGIYALLSVLLAYLAFSELGLGRAVERHGAVALGNREPERLRAYFGTALSLQTAIAVLLGASLAVVGPFVLGLFEVPQERLGEATLALRVIAVSFGINLLLGTVQAPLRAHRDFATLGRIGLFSQTLTTGLLVGAVYLQPTVVAMVTALAIASAVRLLLTLVVSLRRLGGVTVAFGGSELRDLLRFGGSLSASSLLSPILGHAEKLLLGAFVGASALTYYMVPFRALSHFGLVSGALSRALFPRLSALHGQGRRGSMWRSNVRATHLLGWVLLPPFALLAIAGESLLGLWMGTDFADRAADLIPILVLGSFINLLAWNAVALIQAHGQPILVAKAYALEAVFYVPLAWILMSELGLLGAALAWCFRAVLDSALLWWIAASLFRAERAQSPTRFVGGALPAQLAALLLVTLGYLSTPVVVDLVGRLVLGVGVAGLILLLGWLRVFTPDERHAVLRLVQAFRPSRSSSEQPIQEKG